MIKWITSTDHKTIGYLYLITSFVWFAIGGMLALLIRAELFDPGMQVFQSKEQYNQAFTMHGTIMLLLFATPLFAGFANVHHAAADRRARRRVPAAQHARVLVVLLRWHDRRCRVLHAAGRRLVRLVRVRAAVNTVYSPGLGGDLWVFGLRSPASARSSVRSTSSPRSSPCVPPE